jgi:hypothetical protein
MLSLLTFLGLLLNLGGALLMFHYRATIVYGYGSLTASQGGESESVGQKRALWGLRCLIFGFGLQLLGVVASWF